MKSTLSADFRLELYRQMLLVRRFDETALELRGADRIDGVVHPYVGEEAIAVGVCAALDARDRITSTHRGHGHCLAKGADPGRMMAELFGRADGYCKGKGGSMHIADFGIGMLGANGIVGAGMPIATGAALAASMAGAGGASVAFFGDGASNEGVFHECLNIATLWKLPMIFVCENNGWSTATPISEGLAVEGPSVLASGYGLPVRSIDGNDVEAVYEAAVDAVDRARNNDGPTMIEAQSFRMLGHAYRTRAPAEQRDPQVLQAWARRDPIEGYRARLMNDGALSDQQDLELRRSIEVQMDEAVAFAEESAVPDPEDALSDLFAEL